jgi:hypothetical protein
VLTHLEVPPLPVAHAFTSCVDVEYDEGEGVSLDAAVLLDASDPGTTPAPLPGMTPVTGQPGIFRALSVSGTLLARRIAGAWLAVEERFFRSGRGEAELGLLQALQATISLPSPVAGAHTG